MSSIGGPGGIGGPKGPGGASGTSSVDDLDEAGDADEVGHASTASTAARAHGAAATGGPGDVDALSAEVAAGRMTPREAIDRLVDATAGPELGTSERAELRELLTDLVANDPYLGSLAGRA